MLASGLARSIKGSCDTAVREAGELIVEGMSIDLRMRAEGRARSVHDKEQRRSWKRQLHSHTAAKSATLSDGTSDSSQTADELSRRCELPSRRW